MEFSTRTHKRYEYSPKHECIEKLTRFVCEPVYDVAPGPFTHIGVTSHLSNKPVLRLPSQVYTLLRVDNQ